MVRTAEPSLRALARIARPFLPETGQALLRVASTVGRHHARPAGLPHSESFLLAPPVGSLRALLPDPSERGHRVFLVRPRSAEAEMAPRLAAQAFGRAPTWAVMAGSRRLSIFTRQPSPLAECLRARVSGAALGVSVNPSNIDRSVVVAFSEAGKPEVLAKISADEADTVRQQHEWNVLRELAAFPELRQTVPTPLGRLSSGAASVLLTDVVVGSPCPGKLTPRLADWLRRCVRADHVSPTESSVVRRVIEQARRGFGSHSPIAGLVREAAAALGGRSVPRTIVHGDFVPWNITMVRGEPHVFDWEWGALDGLPGWDAAYFAVQSGLILRGWQSDQLLRALSDAANKPPQPYCAREYRAVLLLVVAQIALLGRPGAAHRQSALDAFHRLGAQAWLTGGESTRVI